jgi:hypothetical protein
MRFHGPSLVRFQGQKEKCRVSPPSPSFQTPDEPPHSFRWVVPSIANFSMCPFETHQRETLAEPDSAPTPRPTKHSLRASCFGLSPAQNRPTNCKSTLHQLFMARRTRFAPRRQRESSRAMKKDFQRQKCSPRNRLGFEICGQIDKYCLTVRMED